MTQSLLNPLASAGITSALVRALSSQKSLYEQILTLAHQQTQYIRTGQTEALMTVLGARSRLIEQVVPLDRELQPYKGRWQQVLDGLPTADRKIVGGLLQDVQKLLGDILDLDERDKESLIQQRTLVSTEIKRTVNGAALNRAYGRA